MNVPDNIMDEAIEGIEELHKLKKEQHGPDSLHAKRVFLILSPLRRLQEIQKATCKKCGKHRDDQDHRFDYEYAGGGEYDSTPPHCYFEPERTK